jgi:hypothetical protein
LKWPEENSNDEKPDEDQEEESEINPKIAAREKWQAELVFIYVWLSLS